MNVLCLEIYLFSTIFTKVMNNYLLTICCILLLFSCTKSSPEFVPSQNPFEVMPLRFQQNVLIEHFSDELQTLTVENATRVNQLKEQFNGRLFDANFHQNDFLATPFTSYLSQSLGGAINISQAAINRQAARSGLSNDTVVWLPSPQWESLIYDALQFNDAALSISLETGIISNSKGFANVYIAHKTALPANCKLLIYLLEDEINSVDQQGDTTDFKHQSVFKTTLTSWDGDLINLTNETADGEILKFRYDNILLKEHNILNLKVMAIVYTDSNNFKERKIINVQEVKFNGIHLWDI